MKLSEMVAELRNSVIDCFEDIHRVGQVSPQTHARLKLVAGRTYGLVERVEALEAEVERLKAQEQATSELCRELTAEIEWRRPRMHRWQCSGCRYVFHGRHRDVCPACKRVGYWTGSVDPSGVRWPGEHAPVIIDPEEREKLRKLGRIP